MTPTAVAAWESGAKRPTPATVARLALSLRVEPGFFAMRPSDIAALSGPPHFRSLRSTTQLARDQAFGYGQLAVDIAASLEKHVEYPEPDLPLLPSTAEPAADGATTVLSRPPARCASGGGWRRARLRTWSACWRTTACSSCSARRRPRTSTPTPSTAGCARWWCSTRSSTTTTGSGSMSPTSSATW